MTTKPEKANCHWKNKLSLTWTTFFESTHSLPSFKFCSFYNLKVCLCTVTSALFQYVNSFHPDSWLTRKQALHWQPSCHSMSSTIDCSSCSISAGAPSLARSVPANLNLWWFHHFYVLCKLHLVPIYDFHLNGGITLRQFLAGWKKWIRIQVLSVNYPSEIYSYCCNLWLSWEGYLTSSIQ